MNVKNIPFKACTSYELEDDTMAHYLYTSIGAKQFIVD
jgi:hypothetical protein